MFRHNLLAACGGGGTKIRRLGIGAGTASRVGVLVWGVFAWEGGRWSREAGVFQAVFQSLRSGPELGSIRFSYPVLEL